VVQLVDLCFGALQQHELRPLPSTRTVIASVGALENVTTIVTTPGSSVKLGDTAASAKSSL
jgi:hypothetical protein